jgi:hypothetical protein
MSEYGKPGVTWESEIVICKGGLSLETDAITSGTTQQGSGKILQNFEAALEGGYRRISGYTKWDTHTVPGDSTTPILGVKAALGGVFAARRTAATPTTDIYFSSGSGWGSRINSANRGGNPVKVRFITYSITKPVVVGCDGVNPAFKYDGTTYTLLNGTGSPANPKYAEMFLARLVLAGYSSNPSAITLSAPNDDTDYAGADGALEINVGDVVVGLKNFRNNVYIFGQNRIYKLVGSTSADFAIQPVTTEIGCVDGDTIQEIGGDLLYLAPDGFRSVAGTYNIGDVDLSLQSRTIQPLVRPLLTDISGQVFSSCVIRQKSQYRCMVYSPEVSKANAIGFIGKITDGPAQNAFNLTYTQYDWTTTSGIQCYCADSYFDATKERAVIGDVSNGFVYILESGNDFDGTSIIAVYQSPYLTFKDLTLRKVMQKINLFTQLEGQVDVNLNLNFDFDNNGIYQPASIIIPFTGAFSTYGTDLYGTAAYSGISFPVIKQNLIGSGFTTSFIFTSTGGASYRIDSYVITYSQKGRR